LCTFPGLDQQENARPVRGRSGIRGYVGAAVAVHFEQNGCDPEGGKESAKRARAWPQDVKEPLIVLISRMKTGQLPASSAKPAHPAVPSDSLTFSGGVVGFR
jgi:hypothetical protein